MYNTAMTQPSHYQLNEKDIESTIKFLKATDPDNATPEMAIELLEYFQAGFHTMAEEDPIKLMELYEDFKKTKITPEEKSEV